MRLLLSDCARIDKIMPTVLEHNVGIEIQEYVFPENIDSDDSMAQTIRKKIETIPLRGLHGPFSELVPASRDILIQEVTRRRFQSAYELAKVVGAQHFILHTGYIPKTYPRESWINNSVEFWVDFLSNKNSSMQFHLENVYDDDYYSVLDLLMEHAPDSVWTIETVPTDIEKSVLLREKGYL